MNTRIFLFDDAPDKTTERGVKALEYIFADYLQDEESVGIYPSIKDAINVITKALKDSHVIIFLASLDKYAEVKKKLARSFSLEMEIDEELQNKAFTSLNTILTNSSSEEYAHCIVPVNSRIFALEDGLYSGFSAISGNQTIVCLPWDKERTEVLLTKQVIPYLNSSYNISINDNGFCEFYCKELCDTVSANGADIAIPKTNTSSYFIDYIKVCPELSEAVKNTDRTEKRGNLAPDKYIKNLSIMAKELASSKYGIAISNAYYTGSDENSEKVVYLAVTDDNKTSIREVNSFPGEIVEDFLARTSGDLCTFICDFIEEEKLEEEQTEEINEKTKKEKKFRVGIIIVSIINILLIAGIIFMFFSNKSFNFFENSETTTITETEPTTEEESSTAIKTESETKETNLAETEESTDNEESSSVDTTDTFVVAG